MKFKFFILFCCVAYVNTSLPMDHAIARPASPAQLQDYIQSAIPHGKVKCKECSDLLNTDFLVRHYIEKHHIATQYKYQCIICKLSFAESEKGIHMTSLHETASLAQRRYARYLASLEKK